MPTALVTGGNRGIGLEVCRGLASEGWDVLLGARDRDQGERAAREIGPRARAIALDVTDRASIDAAARAIDGLDALVNNAGIALDGFDREVVRATLAVNLHGALAVTDALLDRVRDGGRIVMVSSGLGELAGIGPKVRGRFDPPRDRAAILEAAFDFERAVAEGRESAEGWPRSAYRVSKVALNACARVLAREHPRLVISAVCPGWVATRMGGPGAPRTPREGASGIVWAATRATASGTYRDARAISW